MGSKVSQKEHMTCTHSAELEETTTNLKPKVLKELSQTPTQSKCIATSLASVHCSMYNFNFAKHEQRHTSVANFGINFYMHDMILIVDLTEARQTCSEYACE